MKKDLQETAREMRRAYQRAWYQKNRESVRKRQEAYWLRKAAAANATEAKQPAAGGK